MSLKNCLLLNNRLSDLLTSREGTHIMDKSTTAQNAQSSLISDPMLGFDHVISYSVDGTGNNLANPSLGAAGSDEVRIAPARFAPGTTDTPVAGPDPRVISNTIFANDQDLNDPGGRSAYTYAFGQFIDHDLDMNPDQAPAADGSNTLKIVIPPGDAFFTPGSTINILRGQIDPKNGNAIDADTSFLDLSQVYGSGAPRPPRVCAMPTAR